ncbi:MAG: serine/threonine-protein kinase [Nannocystaceae bacterium]
MAHADDSVTRRDSDQTRVHPGGDASGDSSSGHGPPLAGFDARWADIGTTLGRYVLVERVGAGGMGTVVRAYDPKLHREVALKRVRRKAIGAEATERMMREAQAMAQLSHPNVVAVHDVEVIDDAVVIAMEYVAGTTLDRWCEQPGRSWRAVLDAYLQAAQGLLAAHRAHLVHRDFKPSNVLVGEDERVKVMDFGLAKPEADAPPSESAMLAILAHGSADSDLDRTLTRADTVVGTPAYMAPEQHTGGTVDARSDQYAFCTTMYEALFGVRPFIGPNAFELARAKRKLLLLPPLRGHDVPAAVRRVVLRGLSPDPAARFASMHELVAALRPRPRRWTPRAAVGLALAGFAAGLACTLALPRADAAQSVEVASDVRSSAPVRVATELTEAAQAMARGEITSGRTLLSDFYFAAVADDRLVDASRAADALSRSYARFNDLEHAEHWRRHAATARARLRAEARDASEDVGDVGPAP